MQISDITVVLPTRNERDNIGAFLASVPAECHLIVVDHSEDETGDFILTQRPNRTLVLRGAYRIPEARQLGADQARTEWLLFTDADVVFAEDFFEQLGDQEGADAIYGCKMADGRFAAYYRWFRFGQRICDGFGIPAVTGSCFLVRRAVLNAVGGFDPALVCNEDSELGWRIRRDDWEIRFAPNLIVHACDHRRLEAGIARKVWHTALRCLLLYFDLIPDRWRRHDWGYWRHDKDQSQAEQHSN